MDYIEIYDKRFRSLIIPTVKIECLYTGTAWAEGPVWSSQGDYLLFSDIPNNRILRWVDGCGVTTYRAPSGFANGNTRDSQGRLISCEHLNRRVTRTEHDGTITVLADSFNGRRLNSPNDVVAASDDSVWFTDPPYGILSDYEGEKSESEQPGNYVYRIDPLTGVVSCVAEDFDKPNGLAFSPDEKVLYIADSGASHDVKGPHHVRRFNVTDGNLSGGDVFAEISPGVPDGLRVDTYGNIWTSCQDGVLCYSNRGDLLGKICIPETVANLCFGGSRLNRMFITAHTSLYAIYLNTKGI